METLLYDYTTNMETLLYDYTTDDIIEVDGTYVEMGKFSYDTSTYEYKYELKLYFNRVSPYLNWAANWFSDGLYKTIHIEKLNFLLNRSVIKSYSLGDTYIEITLNCDYITMETNSDLYKRYYRNLKINQFTL